MVGALEGKVAVIAGATGGFGEAIARRFAAEGARLVLAARTEQKLKPLADALGALCVACDITRSEQVRDLAARTVEELGGLDIAVNTAGYEDACPIATLEPERVERMVAVQFTGALYFLQHMANAMREGGSLITISSLTATLVAEGHAPYAGAKAGINHASRIAASEYGEKRIRINLVSPTLIETEMTRHITSAPGVKQAFEAETPLGRFGRVEDIVHTVAWLASDESSFITGQNIHVDGGTSLRRLPRAADFMRAMRDAVAAKS